MLEMSILALSYFHQEIGEEQTRLGGFYTEFKSPYTSDVFELHAAITTSNIRVKKMMSSCNKHSPENSLILQTEKYMGRTCK